MKSIRITVSYGRIWTVETSTGVRATGPTLQSALDKIVPANDPHEILEDEFRWLSLESLIESIPDSGGDGNIGRGPASA